MNRRVSRNGTPSMPSRYDEPTRPRRHPHAERLGKWAATAVVGSLVVLVIAIVVATAIGIVRFALP